MLIIAVVVILLAVSCIGAGLLYDSLLQKKAAFEHKELPLETRDIGGLFNISVPVGSDFKYDIAKTDDKRTAFVNMGEYDTEVKHILYHAYEYETETAATKLVERNGNYTVWEDITSLGIYFLDLHKDNMTVTLTGEDLELLKEMAATVE
jgi:hypothetical protein